MNILRRTLLLMLVLILPLQGVAGVSMRGCASGMHHAAEPAVAVEHAAMACHHHSGTAMTSEGDSTSSLADDCPHCFALSHFTALGDYTFADERPASAPIPFFDTRFVSLTLDQPERPPASV